MNGFSKDNLNPLFHKDLMQDAMKVLQQLEFKGSQSRVTQGLSTEMAKTIGVNMKEKLYRV